MQYPKMRALCICMRGHSEPLNTDEEIRPCVHSSEQNSHCPLYRVQGGRKTWQEWHVEGAGSHATFLVECGTGSNNSLLSMGLRRYLGHLENINYIGNGVKSFNLTYNDSRSLEMSHLGS
jgi:hypothetical protein